MSRDSGYTPEGLPVLTTDIFAKVNKEFKYYSGEGSFENAKKILDERAKTNPLVKAYIEGVYESNLKEGYQENIAKSEVINIVIFYELLISQAEKNKKSDLEDKLVE